MLQKIAIKMLGDFSVVADGRCVVDATAKLTKPWQLFCYLALNREHVTPSSVLLQELWGGEELADPANVLKNTVYALRRELAGPVKPAESPILFRAGGYCLNGHIKWSVDTERFEQLCEKAERCTGGSEAKMAAWRKAEGAFRGELLPQLADVTPDAVAVVELSSFQLISMRRSPKVAVVTNVTPNHLDHHKDMQEYIDAKRNILLWQTPPCRAVLGFENDITRGMEKDCKGEQVWFTRLHETDRGAFLRESDDTLCYAENGVVTPILPRKEIQLRGLHNVENLLAACAAVWGRVPIEAMRQVGSTFTGVEHRIEPVRTLDGVTYYNDSIASSPTRTIAGLRSFDQKIILIAGGYDKKIPYEPLAPEVLAHVKTLVLMGATGPRIEKAVRECDGFAGSGLTILHADSMQHAVELARGAAKPGDVVSLSPASASFDLYPNFEVRGRDYKNIVKNLK